MFQNNQQLVTEAMNTACTAPVISAAAALFSVGREVRNAVEGCAGDVGGAEHEYVGAGGACQLILVAATEGSVTAGAADERIVAIAVKQIVGVDVSPRLAGAFQTGVAYS